MFESDLIYSCSIETPLGPATACAQNQALTGLWFLGQKYYPAATDAWVDKSNFPVFTSLRAWLADYFTGFARSVSFQLNPSGTSFQKEVWNLLLKIPYGQVATYGEIARKIAVARGLSSMSAQAVGGAVGHNPISILIPCHRVIGSDRNLIGYAGGIDKKKALLRLERVNLP